MIDISNFKWTEYSFQDPEKRNGNEFTQWQMIETSKLDHILDIAEKQGLSPLRSVWLFDTKEVDIERRPIGRKVGDYHIDLDSTDLNIAKEDALYLLDFLQRKYGLNPEYCEIIFSGSKGFSIVIPMECFLVNVPDNIVFMYKLFAEHLKFYAPTIDIGIYISRRQWKLTNSKHPKTGLYRIQLTQEELRKSVDEIKSLAKQPKKVEYKKAEFCKDLSFQMYIAPTQKIVYVIKEKPRKNVIVNFTCLSFEERIPKTLRKTFTHPGRNEAMCKLVGILKRANCPKDDARNICLAFNKKYCSPPKTEDEAIIPFNHYYN